MKSSHHIDIITGGFEYKDDQKTGLNESFFLKPIKEFNETVNPNENLLLPSQKSKSKKKKTVPQTTFFSALTETDSLGKFFANLLPFLCAFNELSISLLKAEYIYVPEYKTLCEQCYNRTISVFAESEENEPKKENNYDDTDLRHFIVFGMLEILELIEKIDYDITNQGKDILLILNKDHRRSSDFKIKRHSLLSNNLLTNRLKDIFIDAFESVIDITTIDYFYTYTHKNCDDLYMAIERMNILSDFIHSPEVSIDTRTESIKEFDEIKKIIIYKAQKLLNQLSPDFKEKYKIYSPFSNNNLPFTESINSTKISSQGYIEAEKTIKEASDISNADLAGFCYSKGLNLPEDITRDEINKYNTRALGNRKTYFEAFKYITNLNISEINENDIEKIGTFCKKNPKIIDVFFKKIRECEKLTENTIKALHTIHQALCSFLERPNDYGVERYKIPFEHSLYIIKDGYLTSYSYEKHKQINKEAYPFFFASLNLEPLYLNKLKLHSKEYATQIFEIEAKYTLQTIDEKIDNHDEKISDTIKNQENKVEEYKSKFKNEISSTNNRTMTILGILGSFIAFTSTSVVGFKMCNNIIEYGIFTGILLLAVLTFVFGIRFAHSNFFSKFDSAGNEIEGLKKKQNELRIHYLIKFISFIVVVIILAKIIFLCINKNEHITKTQNAEQQNAVTLDIRQQTYRSNSKQDTIVPKEEFLENNISIKQEQ